MHHKAKKLDRRALPKPELAPAAPRRAAPASTTASARPAGAPMPTGAALEAALAAIWADVLEVDEVAPEDNFFDLGGHSLAASKLVAAVSAALSWLGLGLALGFGLGFGLELGLANPSPSPSPNPNQLAHRARPL